MAWHKVKILDVVTYLVFAGVALRGLSGNSDHPLHEGEVALLLAFLLLRVSEAWLGRRFEWYPHLYLALQMGLILALSLMPPYVDYFVVLYVPLSVDAMAWFSPRPAYLWIGTFCLATAGVLTYTSGLSNALPFIVMYAGIYLFFASYAAITRRAEESRAESEALLTRLQAAHRELQVYAAQVEELTAAEERNRLARELHDSVTQTIFSMTLTAESARILLERATRPRWWPNWTGSRSCQKMPWPRCALSSPTCGLKRSPKKGLFRPCAGTSPSGNARMG